MLAVDDEGCRVDDFWDDLFAEGTLGEDDDIGAPSGMTDSAVGWASLRTSQLLENTSDWPRGERAEDVMATMSLT